MNQIENSYAIVIGINDYTNNIPCLKTAVNDAKEFTKILRELHQYQVLELLDTDATLERLNELIEDLTQGRLPLKTGTIKIAENDRVLFYFAGHGTIDQDKLEGKDELFGYLLPQDAQSKDRLSFLPMQLLREALGALNCLHLLVILDCCFAGAFHSSCLTREPWTPRRMYLETYKLHISSCAHQLITSAAHDEKAVDVLSCLGERGVGSTGEHSPFAEILFEALKDGKGDVMKDGVITVSELHVYLQHELRNRVHQHQQTVGLRQLRNRNKGEFIFLSPNFDQKNLENAPPLDENTNPYRGLEPYEFNEVDENLFFGRTEAIENLKSHLLNSEKPPLTVVCGSSGTGKSSLVKAGLLPSLQKEEQWHILNPMRPNSSPFTALAITIATSSPIIDQSISNDSNYIHSLSQELRQPKFLIKEINKWGCNNSSKLLLVIDQFEELVTMYQLKEEAEQFLDLLKALLTDCSQHLKILITLRSDFEPYFSNKLLSLNRWMEARFVVPIMQRDELREVIMKPANEKYLSFDHPELVEWLLNEVAQEPAALSLLSFTLSELYRKYLHRRDSDRALKQQDYEDLGGVTGSLTTRATRKYKQLIVEDSAYKKTVRQVMLRMVSLEGEVPARRRVLKSELNYPDPNENKRVETAIKRFSDARLIVGGSDFQGKPYVEPAHDTLVRRWDKLQEWERENRTNINLQRQLTRAAVDWKNNKQLQQFLWHTNPKIDVLKDVLNSNNNWLNTVETEFVQQSLRQKNKDRNLEMSRLIVFFVFIAFAATLVGSVLYNLTKKPNVIFASPGQEIQGSISSYRFVYTTNTIEEFPPNVKNQITIGIENDKQACIEVDRLINGIKESTMEKFFKMNAPKKPGVYYVRFSYALENNCEQAINNWKAYPPGKEIGIIVVGNIFNYQKIWEAYSMNVSPTNIKTDEKRSRADLFIVLTDFKFTNK